MPAFEYVALDQTGRTRKGVEEGDSSRQVRSRLREKGLMPMAVTEVAEKPSLLRMPMFQRRIKPLELSLATRQMATWLGPACPSRKSWVPWPARANRHGSRRPWRRCAPG